MLQFNRCLLGEFRKRKRSFFLLLHLCIPFILPGTLVMYFLSRNGLISSEASYAIFLELIGVGTPAIISIICGMVADSESEAGNFQNMLGIIQSKTISFVSQTTMMIISYSAAMTLTISIYTLALKFLVGVNEVHFTLYFLTGTIFTITSAFQYFFYQVIGYRYGIGICSICGFGGVIIVALSLTTIGDKVWGFLPWAWANRFSKYVMDYLNTMDVNLIRNPMLVTGGYFFLILTIGVIFVSIVWVNRWSGRKTTD
ncbi:lantibiotic immunity ABC transporter MutG family permease subunit [Bacillus sp. FJAT-50079]|uniref:lantibiotic immunity ABC transporter MutG family permease subunit n=1 Tax=Bacillus sp. FJAT-50079 TaxID=2833577 RepID=UPI001BC8D48B|nr:lantibiotic immunity ABC transporter MutG family permease subunit [Bacillus sp. FJAT-50079]MBS4207231.1 lantibiotic immunity ABC transporter MutG family permease subunit [Bacillus sp. FJAT-50079]